MTHDHEADRPDEQIEDLELSEEHSEDVKGGFASVNPYQELSNISKKANDEQRARLDNLRG